MFGFDTAAVVLSSIFYRRLKRGVKPVVMFFNILIIGLSIGAFVLWILTSAGVASYVLVWIAMGLTCGCLLFSIINIVLALTCRQSRQQAYYEYYNQQYQQQYNVYSQQPSYPQQQPQQQAHPAQAYNQPAPQTSKTNLDYIDEIKRLKELLDMNAISVEDFENKKKQLLGL